MTLRANQSLSGLASELVGSFDRSGAGRIQDQVIDAGGRATGEDVAELMEGADDRVGSSFANARGILRREQEALGRPQSERQKAAQRRKLNLAEAATRVDARNRSLGSERDRRRAARSAAFGLNNQITDTAATGLSAAAGMETSREVDFRRQKAQREQQKAAGLGKLAGIGMSFIPGGSLLSAGAG